ncbi:MAG TPA: response regulator [bacterium]|nr:response regulator [bacterium]
MASKFFAKKRILIIGSDTKAITILSSRLVHTGFQVQIANETGEIYRLLKGKPPQLILLDSSMKELDSFDLLMKLRSEKRFRSIPIFILACESEIENIDKALNLGANNYIVKPFDPIDIMEKIKKAVGKK